MKNHSPQLGRSNLHTFLTLLLCSVGAALAIFSFTTKDSNRARGPMLRVESLNFAAASSYATNQSAAAPSGQTTAVSSPVVTNVPTFGHPIIAGIGGTGFEESL